MWSGSFAIKCVQSLSFWGIPMHILHWGGFFAICGIFQAKGRRFYENTLTGLYTGKGELSFREVGEESRRNKNKELFCSRCHLVLTPGGRCELAVASGCNQKLRIALWREGLVRAPRLSASAGLVGKKMAAETELYSAHRRKAAKLPDTQKKEKQKESRCVIKGNEQCTFSSRIRMGTGTDLPG